MTDEEAIELTTGLVARLRRHGWVFAGTTKKYSVWMPSAYAQHLHDIIVPSNPQAGDFEELIRLAHSQLDADHHYYKTEAERLRAALQKISEWDCLNPPNPQLLGDLPWLRQLVDDALKEGSR